MATINLREYIILYVTFPGTKAVADWVPTCFSAPTTV